MKQSTQDLLEKLSVEFQEKQRLHPRNRKKPKINKAVFLEAVANGETKGEALIMAGSSMSKENASKEAAKILNTHPEYRVALADMAEDKVRMAFAQMTAKKAKETSFGGLAVAAGILIDKMPVLRGQPTQRILVQHDLSALSVEQLKSYVQARLSGQKPSLKPGS